MGILDALCCFKSNHPTVTITNQTPTPQPNTGTLNNVITVQPTSANTHPIVYQSAELYSWNQAPTTDDIPVAYDDLPADVDPNHFLTQTN